MLMQNKGKRGENTMDQSEIKRVFSGEGDMVPRNFLAPSFSPINQRRRFDYF